MILVVDRRGRRPCHVLDPFAFGDTSAGGGLRSSLRREGVSFPDRLRAAVPSRAERERHTNTMARFGFKNFLPLTWIRRGPRRGGPPWHVNAAALLVPRGAVSGGSCARFLPSMRQSGQVGLGLLCPRIKSGYSLRAPWELRVLRRISCLIGAFCRTGTDIQKSDIKSFLRQNHR